VDSRRESNGKKKGENNRKNGSRYLAWAFIEAANFAIQHSKKANRFYHRKMQATNGIVARKALAHKIARACCWIMKKQKLHNETQAEGRAKALFFLRGNRRGCHHFRDQRRPRHHYCPLELHYP
jgi:transposase